jgi:hypothetical protein
MKYHSGDLKTRIYKTGLVLIVALLLMAGVGVLPYAHAASSPSPVNLGSVLTNNFVILSESGITNVPASAITGNIGTSPITGASITGITCGQVTGLIYTVDAAGPPCRVIAPALLTTAVGDMQSAYNDAFGRACGTSEGTTNIVAGQTFTTGVYCWTGTLAITGSFTISGSSSDVFIFQVPGTLTVSNGIHVTLSGGASASNIFWQVGGATTIGTSVHFQGIVLDATNIAMQTGASLTGRALAQTAVTLQMNTITAPHTEPTPPPPREQGTTLKCPGTKGLTVTLPSQPKGSTLVLDIKHAVQNDEDSGLAGYWALDYYTVHLQVWKVTDGSYYAIKTYDGIFQTPQGANSPGATSPTIEQQSAFGDFSGGYVATFTDTSTINPSGYPTHGNIGTFNYGGTTADILLGISSAGDPSHFNFLSAYFPGYAGFTQPSWGWVYSLDEQFQSSTSVNTWCNFSSGNAGNIFVTASAQTVPSSLEQD